MVAILFGNDRHPLFVLLLVACSPFGKAQHSSSAFAEPAAVNNNACETGLDVTSFPFEITGSSINATASEDFPQSTICNYGPTDIGVWYSFTGNDRIVSARATTEATGASPARLAVFSGTCENPVCVKRGNGFNSNWLLLEALSGVDYHLVVKGNTGTFNLAFTEFPQRPSNDNRDAALTIPSTSSSGSSVVVAGDSTGAFSNDLDSYTCRMTPASRGVWYKWTAPNDRIATLDISDRSSSYNLAVFEGASPNCLATGFNTNIRWAASTGTEYIILIAGSSTSSLTYSGGTFTLALTEEERPPNDSCDDAVKIPTVPFSLAGSTEGAFSDFDLINCSVDSSVRGIWYQFTAAETRILTLSVDASFRVRLAVFQGTCDLPNCISTYYGFFSSNTDTARLVLESTAGEQYFVLVTGGTGFADDGVFTLAITDTERPLNDSCDTAFEIPSATLPFSLSADTSGAFTDFSSPTCSVDSDARGIWYRFTPTVDRIVTLQIDASDRFRGRIVLFRGACALQGCFDSTIASSSSQQLRWRGVAGEEYTVLVTGNGAGFRDVGPFSLELNDIERPINDSCETARPVDSLSFSLTGGDTRGVYADSTTTCSVSAGARGVWYTFIGGGGEVTIQLSRQTFDSKLVLFAGAECNSLLCVDNDDTGFGGNSGKLETQTVQGTKYSVFVAGADGFEDVGTFDLTIREEDPVTTTTTSPSSIISATPSPTFAPAAATSVVTRAPSYPPSPSPTFAPAAATSVVTRAPSYPPSTMPQTNPPSIRGGTTTSSLSPTEQPIIEPCPEPTDSPTSESSDASALETSSSMSSTLVCMVISLYFVGCSFFW